MNMPKWIWLLITLCGIIIISVGCDLSNDGRPNQPTVESTTTPTTTDVELADPAQSNTVNDEQDGWLPFVITRVPLAPSSERLVDLRLDRNLGRIYISDSTNQLHVLDIGEADHSAAVVATLSVPQEPLTKGHQLLLDSSNNRLYLYTGNHSVSSEETPVITILNTNTLEIVGTLSGRYLSIDSVNNRLFVGTPFTLYNDQDGPGVQIYDGTTLQLVGEIPQAGIPVYNPLRDELLIIAYTVYTADLNTLQVTADLLPAISAQPLPGCNGCDAAQNIHLFTDENLLVLTLVTISTGAGAGVAPKPVFLDGTTLKPAPTSAQRFSLQDSCGSQVTLRHPVGGQVYRTYRYFRYVNFNNLVISDENGELIDWRDGLNAYFVNPITNQAYTTSWYEQPLVLDLETLKPLGLLPPICIFEHDADSGLLYASSTINSNELLILNQSGGWPETKASVPVPTLPQQAIGDMQLSPNYAEDGTLFALVTSNGLYRSTDYGANWTHLHEGLPSREDIGGAGSRTQLKLVFSPDYANDRTLFIGGHSGEAWGGGVLRSTDGGDSWQPMWQGMTHLRVHDLAISPQFATDNSIIAYSEYLRLDPWQQGKSLFRSEDRGLSWSLVMTGTDDAQLPTAGTIFTEGTPAPDLPLRMAEFGRSLERSADGGQSWVTVDDLLPAEQYAITLLPSPLFNSDNTLYVVGEYAVWRTRDGGITWEQWVDLGLDSEIYEQRLTVGIISPLLADNSYQLLLGNGMGKVWVLDPAALNWDPLATPAQAEPPRTPTPVPEPTATLTPLPPLSAEPPQGFHRPQGMFEADWNVSSVALGWAIQVSPANVQSAAQTFEGGRMIWRSDTSEILILFGNGEWLRLADTWSEGQPESDPALTPPGDLFQPIRGFGKVWRDYPSVRNGLGWALRPEKAEGIQVQDFQRGLILRLAGEHFVLVKTGDDGGVWSGQ